MLNVNKLAEIIKTAMKPKEVTAQHKVYANAIITTLKAGIVNNAPGTVTATTVAAAPITNGTASNGLITALLAPTWISIMAAGFKGSNPTLLNKEALGSTTYLMSAAKVTFQLNSIVGNSTATPTSPGILVLGAGNNGKISGLVGSDWAKLVVPPGADSTFSEKLYNEIAEYIMENAVVTYPVGTIVGITPAVSGPLTLGAGAGGIIT